MNFLKFFSTVMSMFHHQKMNKNKLNNNNHSQLQENTIKLFSSRLHQLHPSHNKLPLHKHKMRRKLSFMFWLRSQRTLASEAVHLPLHNFQSQNQKFTLSNTRPKKMVVLELVVQLAVVLLVAESVVVLLAAVLPMDSVVEFHPISQTLPHKTHLHHMVHHRNHPHHTEPHSKSKTEIKRCDKRISST